MLKTMDEAYKILQLQNQQFSPLESFYQITLGNAHALSLENKIGTLAIGSDADITILDSRATSIMKIRMETVKNLIEELFVLQTMGDDRSVMQVYINGKPSKNYTNINLKTKHEKKNSNKIKSLPDEVKLKVQIKIDEKKKELAKLKKIYSNYGLIFNNLNSYFFPNLFKRFTLPFLLLPNLKLLLTKICLGFIF